MPTSATPEPIFAMIHLAAGNVWINASDCTDTEAYSQVTRRAANKALTCLNTLAIGVVNKPPDAR